MKNIELIKEIETEIKILEEIKTDIFTLKKKE